MNSPRVGTALLAAIASLREELIETKDVLQNGKHSIIYGVDPR